MGHTRIPAIPERPEGARGTGISFLALGLLAVAACKPDKGDQGGARLPKPTISLEEAAKPPAGHQLEDTARGETGGYPRYPDVHGGVVVFSAEGDLWQVSSAGGLARRLTVHEGTELFAKFSPDGRWLAFTGHYDGNQDVFLMPAVGGVPRRLTFHPSMDQVIGWTLDGKQVLFRSKRFHPHGAWTAHTVSIEGGDPVRLPLSRTARLTYEPGGKRVAINRLSRDFRRWKRYAGGRAAQIFVGDLEGGTFRKLTTFRGTNAFPMWHGGRIYFLSDRTGTKNIWSTTPAGGDLKQHTRHDDFDVRFPSLGDGKIVYQHRAELWMLELSTGKERPIPVKIISDTLRARTRFTDPSKYLTRFDLSPDGKYLALEIRGDLHLVPAAKEGRQVPVHQRSGERSMGIFFSPDGKEIAATSDASGEVEIFIHDAQGKKKIRQVTEGGTCFKYPPTWSPDGKWLAYADSDNRLHLVQAKGGKAIEIDRSPYGRFRSYTWSPDSKWLAYTKVEENYLPSIFLYQVDRKKTHRVTSEYFADRSPSWSIDGKYLAFLSDRTINPYLDRVDVETILDRTTKPYLVLLSAEARSPFLPRKPGGDEEEAKKKKAGGKAGGDKKKKVKVSIDLEGLAGRIVEVPVKADNYGGVWAGEGVLLYVRWPTLGMADWGHFPFDREFTATLVRFEIKKKKAEDYLSEITGYAVSADGKRIAVKRKKGKLYAFELGPKAPKPEELDKEHRVPVSTIREEVDPRAEWRQIFHEAWRMMRDFYWTADMAGVDWKAMWNKYRVLLPRVSTRNELLDLIGEMMAELSLGHTYVWGGDTRRARPVPVGLLGADLEPHASGYYRFARIYKGANWDKERRSPLTLSHVKVKEGEYLIKIDGRPVKAGDNAYRHLQKAAGQLVLLTVNDKPTDKGAREVELETLKSEQEVRYYTWVGRNREHVAKKTEGRVGYLHIPDMMTRGMVEFDRWFYPQIRKQGLIVDARWNRGGFVSQIMVKRLARKVLSWSRSRSGWVGPYPENTLNGKIVVLTNESAGSDGDIFPRAIQVAKIGPVIGTRTWGGVVGISLANPLVDKGISTRPGYFAWWEPQRGWRLEGEGVEPDIVIDNDPGAVARGEDAQLERGIAEILARLKRDSPRPPAFGASPDKTKKAWVDKYGQTDKP